MYLVLDVGNFRVKGAFFENDHLLKDFVLLTQNFSSESFLRHLQQHKKFSLCLISSVNQPVEKKVIEIMQKENLPFQILHRSQIKMRLEVDEPDQLAFDRIANAYGALVHFSQNDCLIVDIGSTITFDYVTKDGKYQGGAIYLGPELSAKALSNYNDNLPLTSFDKPPSALAKTTSTHIQSGLYYGTLGAIERITDEIKLTTRSPSSVKIIATGGATRMDDLNPWPCKIQFIEDLKDLVDFINPHLTLLGLYEILKEIIPK